MFSCDKIVILRNAGDPAPQVFVHLGDDTRLEMKLDDFISLFLFKFKSRSVMIISPSKLQSRNGVAKTMMTALNKTHTTKIITEILGSIRDAAQQAVEENA